MTGQGSIIFHDVAASFSEEQWMRLEKCQKDVYRNVMKDIHGALLALGYTILNPSIIFRIQSRDESNIRIESHFMEKESAVVGDYPDIIVKIKEELIEDSPVNQGEHCVTDNQSTITGSGPAPSLDIKQEKTTHGHGSFGAETKFTISPPKPSNTILIKKEEEAFSIDDYNNAGEGTAGNSAGVPGVKQEPESGDEEETDNEDLENINGGSCGGKHKTGKTGPLSVEAKKPRMGPRVHGDILSLEEREARRLRVLAGKAPQQPSFTFDTIRTASDIKVENADVIQLRKDTENMDWCKCGHCCQVSTMEESVCCHEISGINYPLNDDCITLHPAFQELCLDQDRLDFLYRFLGRIKRKNDTVYYLHKLRRMSYRSFVVWAHGFLDKHEYKPVPACVVKVVQELLPYPEELNVGYMKIYDYPAAIMALDHI